MQLRNASPQAAIAGPADRIHRRRWLILGVLITSLPDVPAPRKRKIMQMLPAPLLGAPLFMLVQLVRQDSILLGAVLVAGTFLAVMMMAWGKRGGPICFSLLFSMLFSMAAPPPAAIEQIALHGGWFLAGAVLYLLWAVLTTHLLNQRFRAQLLAECLHGVASDARPGGSRGGYLGALALGYLLGLDRASIRRLLRQAAAGRLRVSHPRMHRRLAALAARRRP